MEKVEEQADELYDAAYKLMQWSSEPDKPRIFTTPELLELQVAQSAAELLPLCQQLANVKLMRLLVQDGKACFGLRKRDIASKYAPTVLDLCCMLADNKSRLMTLGEEERLIYDCIEDTGKAGQWVKTLKQRTKITAQTTISKAIKALEQKLLIKQIKTVRNPTQKTYILYSLSPGEGVTGGSWHADGDLDMELIDATSNAILKFIERQSWEPAIKQEHRESITLDDDIASKKRKQLVGQADIEGEHTSRKKRFTGLRWHLANWKHYPNAQSIQHFINSSGFIKREIVLTEDDIYGLMETLIYDEKVEKIGNGYRTIRGPNHSDRHTGSAFPIEGGGNAFEGGNGFTQAPCGRCPVFDLCEPGGPINPSSCTYFITWLDS